MKKSNQALGLSLLLILSGSATALDVPTGQEIYSFSTQADSMSGAAKASNSPSATDVTYLPINVFTHVEHEDHFWNGQTTVGKGLVEPISHVTTYSTNQYGEDVMEACFPEPIPVNAAVLVPYAGSYQQRAVDIPGYRSDRMCMNVPYSEFYMSSSSFYRTEYVVIIE